MTSGATSRFALYDHLLSPVCVAASDLTVVYFNQAFAQFLQLPPRKIRGKPLQEVVVVDAGGSLVDEARAAARGAKPVVTGEWAIRSGDLAKEVVLKIFPLGEGELALAIQDFSLERVLHAKHRIQLDELKAKNAEIKRYSEGLEVLVDARTAELRTAKEETEGILKSIREGIFVVERSLKIGSQCSGAALAMLRKGRLEGTLAVDALFPEGARTNQGEVRKKLGDFLASAFNLFIPEQFEDLVKFAPKALRFPAAAAGERPLAFNLSYSAVISDAEILRLVVAVRDDTELEALRDQAALVHRRVAEALALLGKMTSGAEGDGLRRFVKEAHSLVAAVSQGLGDRAKLDVPALFRHLHTIKGGARHYRLAFLEHFAHQAEDVLDLYRARPAEVTDERRSQLVADVQSLSLGLEALVELGQGSMPKTSPPGEWRGFVADLHAAVDELARELGKPASLEVHCIGEPSGDDLLVLNHIVSHLMRNALDHGLEAPEHRRRAGKSPTGRLKLALTWEGGTCVGQFSDDGGGIDRQALELRAKNLGLVYRAADATLRQTLEVLAAPGLTTKDAISLVSGRGVGLDAVVNEVRSRSGSLELDQSDASGTVFTFFFKLRNVAKLVG